MSLVLKQVTQKQAIGCHESFACAVVCIMKDLDVAYLEVQVIVPAVNRWVKLYTPLAYWHVGNVLGIQESFNQLAYKLKTGRGALSIEALVGIEDETTFEQKRAARFKKSAQWMDLPLTIKQQATGVSVMQPIVALMGKFFAEARWEDTGYHS